MFKLDNNFLVSLGLGGLPVEEKNRLLQMVYERLEMNVGMRLAEKMSDQQLDEFESFIDGNVDYARNFLNINRPGWEQSEDFNKSLETAKANAQRQNVQFNENPVISEFAALKWLETNFPNYKDVVAEELEKLKGEVTQAAPQILSASQAAAAGAPQRPAYAPGPTMPMPNYQAQQGYGPAPQQQQPAYAPQQPYGQAPQPYQQAPAQAPAQQPYQQQAPPMPPAQPAPAPSPPPAPMPQPASQPPQPSPYQPPAPSAQPPAGPGTPPNPQHFTPPPPGYMPGQ